MPTGFCHLVTSIRLYVQLWHGLCRLLMDESYTKIESNVNNAGEKKVNMLDTETFIFLHSRYINSLRHAERMSRHVPAKLASTHEFFIY
jgi:hypothetical protein